MEKELKDISWLVDEATYRQDPALSYSTLARYDKEGFNKLDSLFEQISTPSLLYGSIVDALVTGGEDEFKDRFIVIDINITDSGMDICKYLVSLNLPYDQFKDIPEDAVSTAAKYVGFWKDDKWDARRYKEVMKTGDVAEYYYILRNSDKTVISTTAYQDALNCVSVLKESPATRGYFADNDELSPIRRYYQLKFKATFNNVDYRNMADLIVVDYNEKRVYPVDLKTSSHTEWDFQESFVQWRYMIQARLYWRIIRANMDKDPYFKDFTLENYRFIVINKRTLTPLVWEFPLTQSVGTLIDDKGNEHRDPFDLGEELQAYLNLKPAVPNGIDKDGINIINCLRLKEDA